MRRIHPLVAGIGLLLAVICALAHTAAAMDSAVLALREKANGLADEERFNEALAVLEKIQRDYPGNIDVDFDILAVLAWSGRYENAADMALSLPLEQAPDHVRQAAAMAYRETGRLKKSELLYLDLLSRHPDNPTIAEGLALTLVKACNLQRAGDLIARYKTAPNLMTTAETALVMKKRDQAAALAQDGKYDEALALLRALRQEHFGHPGIEHDRIAILSWMGNYAEAAALADSLNLSQAPAQVQSAAAKAYRETGDIEKAETLYRSALARDPANAEIALGLALTAIEKSNLEEAELLLERYEDDDPDLMSQAEKALLAARRVPEEAPPRHPGFSEIAVQNTPDPDERRVKPCWMHIHPSPEFITYGAQQSDTNNHGLHELRLAASWAHVTSGINPVRGKGDDPSIEARLYGKTFAGNWRVFGGYATAAGDYDEGHARQNILLGGLEYSSAFITAQLEARADTVHDTKFGLQLSGAITPNECWTIPFNLELNSRETPLRARNSDITAKAAGSGLSYGWSENGSASVLASFLDFSDDNRRLAVTADVTERLFARNTHSLDGSIHAYASWNSLNSDRPYFNPKRDLELSAALTYGNRLWQRGDRAFGHSLSAAAGKYYQRYYGSGLVWSLAYSHSWELGKRFMIDYGIGYGRHMFDGESERSLTAFASAVFRF
jgi:Thioredoxin domain-containing protein